MATNNKLTPENLDNIVDAFANRTEKAHFSHLASYEEIEKQEYNLSVSTYVEAEDTREEIDIAQLNAEIAQIVAREQKLREAIDLIVKEIEGESHMRLSEVLSKTPTSRFEQVQGFFEQFKIEVRETEENFSWSCLADILLRKLSV